MCFLSKEFGPRIKSEVEFSRCRNKYSKKHWSKVYTYSITLTDSAILLHTVNEYVTTPRVNASVVCGNATVSVSVPSWQVMNGAASNVFPTPMRNCSNATYGYNSWDRSLVVLVVPLGSCGTTIVVIAKL